jgi:hypothetical protein
LSYSWTTQDPLDVFSFLAPQPLASERWRQADLGGIPDIEWIAAIKSEKSEIGLYRPSEEYSALLAKVTEMRDLGMLSSFVLKKAILDAESDDDHQYLEDPNFSENAEPYHSAIIGYYLNRLRFHVPGPLDPQSAEHALYRVVPLTPCFMRVIDWFKTLQVPERPIAKARNRQVFYQNIIMERANRRFEQDFPSAAGNGPLDIRKLLAFITIMLHALEVAWSFYGFLHYDLHTGNVMVKDETRATDPVASPQGDHKVRDAHWRFERLVVDDDDDDDTDSVAEKRALTFSPEDHGNCYPFLIDFGLSRLEAPFRDAAHWAYGPAQPPPDYRPGDLDAPRHEKKSRIFCVETFTEFGIVKSPPNRGYDIRRFAVVLLFTWHDQLHGLAQRHAHSVYEKTFVTILMKMTGLRFLPDSIIDNLGDFDQIHAIARHRKNRPGEDFVYNTKRHISLIRSILEHGQPMTAFKYLFAIEIDYFKALRAWLDKEWTFCPRIITTNGDLMFPLTPTDILDDELLQKLYTTWVPEADTPVASMALARTIGRAHPDIHWDFTPIRCHYCTNPIGTHADEPRAQSARVPALADRHHQCGQCHRVVYCNKLCQELDWPTHHVQCRLDDPSSSR